MCMNYSPKHFSPFCIKFKMLTGLVFLFHSLKKKIIYFLVIFVCRPTMTEWLNLPFKEMKEGKQKKNTTAFILHK